MSEERTETSPAEAQTSAPTHGKGGSLWILWAFMALLLAYPPSIGPVARYYTNKNAPTFVHVVYWPIAYLNQHSARFHRVLDWYLHLWGTSGAPPEQFHRSFFIRANLVSEG